MLLVPAACVATVALMVGAAYASVPLYNLFCRLTGFDGTPSVASVEALPAIEPREREVTIRFDANVANGLPWAFRPEQRTMRVRIGEVAEASYVIENLADRRTVGSTTYNVSPFQAGGYFTKIECFCFTATALGPREKEEVRVVFYVDPAFDDDKDAKGVHVITLSYTFFPTPGGTAPGEG
jgi:cytochrome c oxidase assembly protein subunit 11